MVRGRRATALPPLPVRAPARARDRDERLRRLRAHPRRLRGLRAPRPLPARARRRPAM